MKTASHFSYFGPGRIVISRSSPRGVPGGYRVYKALAPADREMLRMPFERYRERFMAQLGQLDARKVWDELHALAGDGVEPVLQCFEKPPFTETNFCHRRMVAEWFAAEIRKNVQEIRSETCLQN